MTTNRIPKKFGRIPSGLPRMELHRNVGVRGFPFGSSEFHETLTVSIKTNATPRIFNEFQRISWTSAVFHGTLYMLNYLKSMENHWRQYKFMVIPFNDIMFIPFQGDSGRIPTRLQPDPIMRPEATPGDTCTQGPSRKSRHKIIGLANQHCLLSVAVSCSPSQYC